MDFCPGEGGIRPHGLEASPSDFLPFVPLGPACTPERGYISAICGKDEVTNVCRSTVSHRIDLSYTNFGRVPTIHTYRHHGYHGTFLCCAFPSEVPAGTHKSTRVYFDTPQAHSSELPCCDIGVAPYILSDLDIDVFSNLRV